MYFTKRLALLRSRPSHASGCCVGRCLLTLATRLLTDIVIDRSVGQGSWLGATVLDKHRSVLRLWGGHAWVGRSRSPVRLRLGFRSGLIDETVESQLVIALHPCSPMNLNRPGPQIRTVFRRNSGRSHDCRACLQAPSEKGLTKVQTSKPQLSSSEQADTPSVTSPSQSRHPGGRPQARSTARPSLIKHRTRPKCIPPPHTLVPWFNLSQPVPSIRCSPRRPGPVPILPEAGVEYSGTVYM